MVPVAGTDIKYLVHGTWYRVLVTRYQVPWLRIPGTCYQVTGSEYRVPGTGYRVLRYLVTGYQVPGTWYQVPGARYQVIEHLLDKSEHSVGVYERLFAFDEHCEG